MNHESISKLNALITILIISLPKKKDINYFDNDQTITQVILWTQ